MLAAREDRRDYLVQLGGQQYENNMTGRLFQGLEQRVVGLRRQHVRLIEDIHLVPTDGGGELDLLPELADIVYAAIGRRVHLDYIHRIPGDDSLAHVTLAAGVGCRPVLAVERRRQDPSGGRLAGPARPGQQIRMSDAVVGQGVLQRLGDVLLPDDVVKAPGAVLQTEGDVGHLMSTPLCTASRRHGIVL